MPFREVLPRVQHDLKWICLQRRLCSWRQRQCSLPRWLLLHGWLHARGLPGRKVLPVQLKRDHTLPRWELLSVCELSANSMPDGRLLPSCGGQCLNSVPSTHLLSKHEHCNPVAMPSRGAVPIAWNVGSFSMPPGLLLPQRLALRRGVRPLRRRLVLPGRRRSGGAVQHGDSLTAGLELV